MSLFRKAGQKFEETKRSFVGGDDSFVCEDCEESVDGDYDHCPHCGADAVVAVD